MIGRMQSDNDSKHAMSQSQYLDQVTFMDENV